MKTFAKKNILKHVFKFTFYISFNLLSALLYGFLTIDGYANTNSRVGAILLSILIPILIVERTANFSGMERLLKFGTGLILYLIAGIVLHDANILLEDIFLPTILLTLFCLYFGDKIPFVNENE